MAMDATLQIRIDSAVKGAGGSALSQSRAPRSLKLY